MNPDNSHSLNELSLLNLPKFISVKTVLKIQNIKCEGCASTIANRLERLHGVLSVAVVPESDQVTLEYTEDQILEAAIYKLGQLGYPLETAPNPLGKKAISFVSCAIGRMS